MAKIGDYDGAMAFYANALKLDPYYHEVYRVRGMMKAGNGDIKGALIDVNKTIELDPKYAEAYGSLGCLHYDLRDYAIALAEFQRCCELTPKLSEDFARCRIWLIQTRAGDKDSATKDLQTYFQGRKANVPKDWGANVVRFLTGCFD